jgi:RNA polymerase-binding transcription factor DksA
MELDIAAAEKALRGERESLVHQMHELGATESGDLTGDVNYGDGFSDAGAATAERTEVMGVVEALKTQLEGIDAALARVAEGTYGTCATCGNEIGADRLEFRPSSIYCVSCKSSQR